MNQTYSKGFTLVELMTALAVAAIILTVGIPSFREYILANSMTSKVNAFAFDLNFTRSEAIKRGVRVTMCKSADKASCASSGGWEQGWIIYVDDGSNPEALDPGEQILKVVESFGGSLTLRGNTNVKNNISYPSSGSIGLGNSGSLIFCDDRISNFSTDKAKARVVIISPAGRIRTVKGDNSTVSLTSCYPS